MRAHHMQDVCSEWIALVEGRPKEMLEAGSNEQVSYE